MTDVTRLPLLPESRPRHRVNQVWRAGFWQGGIWIEAQWWEYTYCANCGVPDGLVTARTMMFAFSLCNDCYQKHGHIEGTFASPIERFAGAVVGEQIARYGRQLTDAELVTVAEGTSPLATLLNRGVPAILGG